jgi:hypothetical protein
MLIECKSIGCNALVPEGTDFCVACENTGSASHEAHGVEQSMSQRYPKYFKSVGHLTEIDVYATHMLFGIQDPSGCLHHASKKLLLSGVRTGGKSAFKDIAEARDTLTRWLQLNQEQH